VLIDDLVLQGVTEPYRMLTARSEYRLALRADNAALRLTDKGVGWGCVGPERAMMHAAFSAAVADASARARREGRTPAQYAAAGVPVNQDGRWRSVLETLALPSMPAEIADRMFPWLRELPSRVRAELDAQALYAPYLERQATELRVLEREEKLAIPTLLDFALVPGLSAEMRQRLAVSRPATLGGAGRIPGITPAALAALAVHLRRAEVGST
jgi:tRNA uridine 5-carboxymethylaminomethyl modification enzyme